MKIDLRKKIKQQMSKQKINDRMWEKVVKDGHIELRKQLKGEMAKKKINTPEMARRIGANQQTLYDYFSGRKALGADYLQAILNELKAKITFE